MKVVDHQPQSWFLLEEDGDLFIDVNCSHSFIGYGYLIQLNDEEKSIYECSGRAYIDWLSQDIHNSVPILIASTSKYKTRKATSDIEIKAHEAISDWLDKNRQNAP
jgi:hypothetical protein